MDNETCGIILSVRSVLLASDVMRTSKVLDAITVGITPVRDERASRKKSEDKI
jgi:hypothetical protein